MSAWSVLYTHQFDDLLMELTDRDYEYVEHSIDILASNPGLARSYDPLYESAYPPVPCLWYHVPRTTKDLYLVADEEASQLTFIFMTDVRENPRRRFSSMSTE